MTCIVGIQTPEGVLIGGDSVGVSYDIHTRRGDPKVFTNGAYVIGYTTSFRMGQLLRWADLPKPLDREGDDLDRFMATDVIDVIRKAFKDGGYATKDKEQELGGEFLVGVSGRLYKLASDYSVGWSLDGYDAAGQGRAVALGSLHATGKTRMAPQMRARRALEAAAWHMTGVEPPFTVMLGRYAKENP